MPELQVALDHKLRNVESRVVFSVAMAGLIAILAVISIPLPWSPVPFSMAPLGLLLAGVMQRARYALLSVAIYLAAGAMGAPIFADRASGIEHFIGYSAGYLWGFLLVSPLASAMIRNPEWFLSTRVQIVSGALVLTSAVTMILAWAIPLDRIGLSETHSDWGWTQTGLFFLMFITVAGGFVTVFLLRRGDEQSPLVRTFVLFLSIIIALHVFGVLGLWLIGGTPLWSAIILGSLVFLPMDLAKAGGAAIISSPWLHRKEVTE